MSIDPVQAENAALRQENAALRQERDRMMNWISYAEQELARLHGQLIGQPYDPVADQQEGHRRNIEAQNRQSQRELEAAEQREKVKQEILKEFPSTAGYCEDQINKAKARQTMLLEKAEQFYLLSEDQLSKYVQFNHDSETSAVYNLLNEYEEGGNIWGGKPRHTVYEYDYCEERFESLSSFEVHCWKEGDSHNDASINRISKLTHEAIQAAQLELDNEVNAIIKHKADEKEKAVLEASQKENAKLKKSLPYVPK